jgi:hypothetical protein
MLSKENISYIAECAEVSAQKMKPVHGGCLYYSSMFAAMINDNTSMRADLVVGSLDVENTTIFSHSPLKDILNSGSNIVSQWDGHAWVTIDDLICDVTLFQTIYSGQSPEPIVKLFSDKFGEPKPYIIGQEHKLKEMNIVYSKKETLDDNHITLFIQNAVRLGLVGSS